MSDANSVFQHFWNVVYGDVASTTYSQEQVTDSPMPGRVRRFVAEGFLSIAVDCPGCVILVVAEKDSELIAIRTVIGGIVCTKQATVSDIERICDQYANLGYRLQQELEGKVTPQ